MILSYLEFLKTQARICKNGEECAWIYSYSEEGFFILMDPFENGQNRYGVRSLRKDEGRLRTPLIYIIII